MFERLTTKQTFVLISFLIVFIVALQYLFTHTLLVISSSSTNQLALQLRSAAGSQDFHLGPGESKTFLLSKGHYNIEVSQNDDLAVYHKDLGGFSRNNVEVDTQPQKSAIYLGKSTLGCAVEQTPGLETAYYACGENSDQVTRTRDGVSILEAAAPNYNAEGEAGLARDISAKNTTIRPYKDGFLRVVSLGNALEISELKQNGQPAATNPITIDNFEGVVSANTFSVISGKTSSAFVVLDNKQKSVLVFKDAQDKNPTKIDIADRVTTENGADLRVLASKNYIHVYNTQGLIEGNPTDETQTNTFSKPKDLVIDTSNSEVVAEHKLDSELFVRNLSIGPSGNTLLVPLYNKESFIYLATGSDKPKRVELVSGDIGDSCWKNDNSFYYSTDSGSSIYLYDLEEGVSRLVYSTLVDTVSNMECDASGSLYFSLTAQDDYSLRHYKLENKNMVGVRLESVLPIYIESGGGALAVTSYRNTIVVKSLGGAPAKNTAKQKIITELKEKGVNTDSLEFNFSY